LVAQGLGVAVRTSIGELCGDEDEALVLSECFQAPRDVIREHQVVVPDQLEEGAM
jgi:hypothetical protein